MKPWRRYRAATAEHPSGTYHLPGGIHHYQHHAGNAIVLSLPIRHVVVEPGGVYLLTEEADVLAQLSRDPRVVAGARPAALI